MAIDANHVLRSSITSMRNALQRIIEDGTSKHVEREFTSVAEVWRLHGMADKLTEQDTFEEGGRFLSGVPSR